MPVGVGPGTIWGWGCDTVLSPTTPWTSGATAPGTDGALGENRARRPLGSWVSTSDTSNAVAIWATDPVTGMRRPSGEVAPSCRPVEASQARTAPIASEVGPNVVANCPGAR